MKPRLAELVRPRIRFKDIAERYGCDPSFVSQIASGHRKPTTRFKLLVSEMLGLPVSVVFPEGDENGQTSNS